jgi:hypothetical protein
MTGYPAMFSLGVDAVTNQRDWANSDHDMYLRLAHKASERGVMPDHDDANPGSCAMNTAMQILTRH